ncbi:Hypothetical protein Minf_2257 [Methylacidiphilum infernorum V4]|uniref:Uncharacterized protein n=1 Tax=Methylacidiphilum infernorum (isolate V4) TaxID=481448 RepID=B3E082_METI4|nr:Hypothetical protein Minf_2257 [Methylacidiphilum infernorum V4]
MFIIPNKLMQHPFLFFICFIPLFLYKLNFSLP